MLYRTEDEWKLMPLVATFLQHEQTQEMHVIDETELRAHEEMAHVDELEFKAAEYDQETLDRLEEVKGFPEDEFNTVDQYVIHNNVVEGTSLALKKQIEILESSILETAMMQMGGMF